MFRRGIVFERKFFLKNFLSNTIPRLLFFPLPLLFGVTGLMG